MSESETKLVINKTINASVATVYEAWTNPEIIKEWFGPSDQMTVPNAEVDLRVGGQYLIHMLGSDGTTDHIVSGEYEEIVPEKKLQFNWIWKDGVERTKVSVELSATNENQTLLTLTHWGFGGKDARDAHNDGWSGCLDRFLRRYQ